MEEAIDFAQPNSTIFHLLTARVTGLEKEEV